ncbi:uncharacterized protein TNCV_3480581 [Trichonephila clavipes]|nr:uncharacterized protein TNCV_3480581 [Trichonephila clavipes]
MRSIDCNGVELTVIGLWTCGKLFFGVMNLALQSGNRMDASGLRSQPNRPSSLQALTSAAMDAWKAISMVIYQTLVESLPKRVQAVIHQEHSRGYPKHTDFKFVRQSGNSTYTTAIYEKHPKGVLQQHKTRPHIALETQRALQRVGMLPLPARAPNLSLIEYVWDIIG